MRLAAWSTALALLSASMAWGQGTTQGLKQGPAMAVPTDAPASVPAGTPTVTPVGSAVALGAVMPMAAAGFTRGGIIEFEGRPGGAGLGAAAEYRPASGAGVATVYLYDRGRHDLQDGPASPAVEQELQAALAEVRAVAAVRRYTVATLAELPPVAGAEGAPALRCLALLLAYEGGRNADSFICAGVVHGRFLKLRATLPAAEPGAAAARVRELGQAVAAAAVKAS